MAWELIWMLVILKIPVVYLCCVVWWAIRAKPAPLEPALRTAPLEDNPKPGWHWSRLGARGRPDRGYRRDPARVAQRS